MESKIEELLRENGTVQQQPAASITQTFANNYKWLMVDLRDPRTDNLMFMYSPWPILGCCLLYYYVVRVWGPSFMKNRPPYEIKNIMLAYNLFQTVFSAWMFYRTGTFWLTGRYSWVCEPVDYSNSPTALDAMDVTWWYFFSKFIDYTDSIFFVLRKKFDNLSTLHVIHHGIMPFTAWWGIRYVGGGQTMFCGFLNMGIHTIMYSYYFLAALGPQMQPYLWWKKYLTKLQLLQFASFTLHAIQPIFIDCGFPPFYCFVILGHGAMFFAMFANFYVQAYLKKGAKNKLNAEHKKNDEETEDKKAVDSHQRRKDAKEHRKTIDVVPT